MEGSIGFIRSTIHLDLKHGRFYRAYPEYNTLGSQAWKVLKGHPEYNTLGSQAWKVL